MDNPTKGDCAIEAKVWIIEYEFGTSYEEVSEIKKSKFENIVHEKVTIEAFQYLKIKVKSKGSSINYGDRLEMHIHMAKSSVELARLN